MRVKSSFGADLVKMSEKTISSKSKLNKDSLENLFLHQMRCLKIPMPQRKVKFHPTRQFEWDFVWPSIKFWVEVDGGEYMVKGGHNTGKGINRDREKDAEAFLLGYRGLRFTGTMVKDGSAVKYLETAFNRGLFNGNIHT